MSRDPLLYVEDILQACERITQYTAGMDYEQFSVDPRTIDAVVRNLEIVGEASKHLPTDLRDACPQIPWKEISGMRDVLAHAYFGVDEELVWDVVQNHVEPLRAALQQVVGGAST